MTKKEFLNSLINQNLFWSYDPEQIEQLDDSIIIEHVLIFGNVLEILQLFNLFEFNVIEDVWRNNILWQKRYKKLNFYLGKFIFRVNDIESQIKKAAVEYPRLERFKLLIAKDK